MNSNVLKLLLAFSLFAVPSIADCQSVKAETSKSYNLVVILIDTLRADHLPFYGYEKNTAPFLNELSKKSIVFERAFSSSSYTAPAVASIFTSMLPSQHGVIVGKIANERLAKSHSTLTLNRIPESLRTLAEELQDVGFRTFGVADNLNITDEMGFTQGFDKFQTYHYKAAKTVNAKVKEWASDIQSGGRYFLYIHYMDTHHPYQKHAPWFKKGKNAKETMVNAYDSNINYLDVSIQELYKLFGWDKNTILVLLADHGEEFWEHGNTGHGKTLYREVLHVPWFILHPDLQAKRIKQEVTTVDLMPTLGSLLSIPSNSNWRGESLMPTILEAKPPQSQIVSELLRSEEQSKPDRRSIISDSWHLITLEPVKGEPSYELFNLDQDFLEKQNRATKELQIKSNLASKLETFKSTKTVVAAEQVEIPIEKETLDQLRSLGYIE